jgi:hypothetical protein
MSTWFSAAAVLPQLRAEWDLSSGEGAWLTIAVQLGFVAGAVAAAVLNISQRCVFEPIVKSRWRSVDQTLMCQRPRRDRGGRFSRILSNLS